MGRGSIVGAQGQAPRLVHVDICVGPGIFNSRLRFRQQNSAATRALIETARISWRLVGCRVRG